MHDNWVVIGIQDGRIVSCHGILSAVDAELLLKMSRDTFTDITFVRVALESELAAVRGLLTEHLNRARGRAKDGPDR